MIHRADAVHTLEFVKEYITNKNASILEVGCGTGNLATLLSENGYRVMGIDTNPEAVERARRNGVQAEVADITQFESGEKFDAVLFTRSLHHIQALDQALAKAKLLLGELGRVLVEDFSLEMMDEKTATWFYELKDFVTLLLGNDAAAPPAQDLAPLARWKSEHHHEPPLHTRKVMLKALEKNIGNVYSTPAPYLYRYFIESFESIGSRPAAVQKFLDLEKRQIELGIAQPIGLRISAKKYFSYLR